MCKTNGWKPVKKIFQIKLIMGECEDVGIKPCLGGSKVLYLSSRIY